MQFLVLELVLEVEGVPLGLGHLLVIVVLILHAAPLDGRDLLSQLLKRFFRLSVLVYSKVADFEIALLIFRSD